MIILELTHVDNLKSVIVVENGKANLLNLKEDICYDENIGYFYAY